MNGLNTGNGFPVGYLTFEEEMAPANHSLERSLRAGEETSLELSTGCAKVIGSSYGRRSACSRGPAIYSIRRGWNQWGRAILSHFFMLLVV